MKSLTINRLHYGQHTTIPSDTPNGTRISTESNRQRSGATAHQIRVIRATTQVGYPHGVITKDPLLHSSWIRTVPIEPMEQTNQTLTPESPHRTFAPLKPSHRSLHIKSSTLYLQSSHPLPTQPSRQPLDAARAHQGNRLTPLTGVAAPLEPIEQGPFSHSARKGSHRVIHL